MKTNIAYLKASPHLLKYYDRLKLLYILFPRRLKMHLHQVHGSLVKNHELYHEPGGYLRGEKEVKKKPNRTAALFDHRLMLLKKMNM